jgi:CheY-like chemotaxis protein
MPGTEGKKYLGDLLVEAGLITPLTLSRALDRQRGSRKRLGEVLEEMGVITQEELVSALAKQLRLKIAKGFASHSFPETILKYVPADLAVSRSVFPLKSADGMLAVALPDPFDADTIDFLAKKTAMKIIPVLATRSEIMEAVSRHYLKGKTEPAEKKRTVLVVDDTRSVAAIVEVALKKEGYDVLVAYDGLDALKLAVAEVPDLVLCEATIPRMDGYGLFRALLKNPATADIPVILLTSKGSGEEEQRALGAGFFDFIAKPVQPIRVVARVGRAFEIMKRIRRGA